MIGRIAFTIMIWRWKLALFLTLHPIPGLFFSFGGKQ